MDITKNLRYKNQRHCFELKEENKPIEGSGMTLNSHRVIGSIQVDLTRQSKAQVQSLYTLAIEMYSEYSPYDGVLS